MKTTTKIIAIAVRMLLITTVYASAITVWEDNDKKALKQTKHRRYDNDAVSPNHKVDRRIKPISNALFSYDELQGNRMFTHIHSICDLDLEVIW